MSRRPTTLALGLAGAAALVAVSGVGASQAADHGAGDGMRMSGMHQTVLPKSGSTIIIKNFGFTVPASVAPHATVTVVNKDSTTHSVTRNGGGFSVVVPAHKTRTFKAPGAGTYKFHCKFHSDMHGTLHVR